MEGRRDSWEHIKELQLVQNVTERIVEKWKRIHAKEVTLAVWVTRSRGISHLIASIFSVKVGGKLIIKSDMGKIRFEEREKVLNTHSREQENENKK